MTKKLEIKKLNQKELLLAKELFLSFQTDDGVENPTFSSDEYLLKLLQREDFHVVAALENGKVIGGLTAYEISKYKAEETEMFLYEIGVNSTHRKKGAATGLIEYLKNICCAKGIKVIFVLTEADNLPARGLYEKTGGKGFSVVEFDYELQ